MKLFEERLNLTVGGKDNIVGNGETRINCWEKAK